MILKRLGVRMQVLTITTSDGGRVDAEIDFGGGQYTASATGAVKVRSALTADGWERNSWEYPGEPCGNAVLAYEGLMRALSVTFTAGIADIYTDPSSVIYINVPTQTPFALRYWPSVTVR